MNIVYENNKFLRKTAYIKDDAGNVIADFHIFPMKFYQSRSDDLADPNIPYVFQLYMSGDLCSVDVIAQSQDFHNCLRAASLELFNRAQAKAAIIPLADTNLFNLYSQIAAEVTYEDKKPEQRRLTFLDNSQTKEIIGSWPGIKERFIQHEEWKIFLSIIKTANIPLYNGVWWDTAKSIK
jgi:hypothetical protein